MGELFEKYSKKFKGFWENKNKKQKIILIGSVISIILLIGISSFFATRTTLVPLYSNLKPSETGSIKESLDEKGIKSEITNGGTVIKVPKEQVETLMVELAAEGIPKSGNIDYSFFGQNAGFGMTDNEFNILKLDATQTEIATLLETIDGIDDATVRINMPNQGVFVADTNELATAAITIHTKAGHEFTEKQIRSLYHLVSKSIPNLPVENISIRNQFLDYYDLDDAESNSYFTNQMQIKSQIEKDIQRQVHNMLGTLIGYDKVITTVTADIDFTQENREENLVTPVDEENMKGIAISAQRITETYTGTNATEGGVPETDDTDVGGNTTYQAGADANGDIEKNEEILNNEVNRIRKQIVESPYKVRDLGIQVVVEPPNPDDVNSFPLERRADIEQILSTIVRTSIDKEIGTDLSDEAVQSKITVSVQPFGGKQEATEQVKSTTSIWTFVIGGILLMIIAVLLFFVFRRKNQTQIEEVQMQEQTVNVQSVSMPDIDEEVDSETNIRNKQLEKMAKEKPEEFAKLLRTWLAEE